MTMLCASKAYCFDDKDTHPRFTAGAIENTLVSNYLEQYLGLVNGVKATLPYYNDTVVMDGVSAAQIAKWNAEGWPILELLKAGSASEDTPDCRAANHLCSSIFLLSPHFV